MRERGALEGPLGRERDQMPSHTSTASSPGRFPQDKVRVRMAGSQTHKNKLGRPIQVPAGTQGREAGVGGGRRLLMCFRLKKLLLGQKPHHSSAAQAHPHMGHPLAHDGHTHTRKHCAQAARQHPRCSGVKNARYFQRTGVQFPVPIPVGSQLPVPATPDDPMPSFDLCGHPYTHTHIYVYVHINRLILSLEFYWFYFHVHGPFAYTHAYEATLHWLLDIFLNWRYVRLKAIKMLRI